LAAWLRLALPQCLNCSVLLVGVIIGKATGAVSTGDEGTGGLPSNGTFLEAVVTGVALGNGPKPAASSSTEIMSSWFVSNF